MAFRYVMVLFHSMSVTTLLCKINSDIIFIHHSGLSDLVVIQVLFDFSGNIVSRLYQPYTTGEPGSDCPTHYNKTSGLCGECLIMCLALYKLVEPTTVL